MKYDVCIVGAGPAGLSAAFELSRHGASVALVDRHQHPGSKACGGGLTNDALQQLSQMVSVLSGSSDVLSEQLAPCRALTVFSGKISSNHALPAKGLHRLFHEVQLQQMHPYMHVSQRIIWQSWLLRALENLGVTLFLGSRARGIIDGRLALSNGTSILADYFVAADGAKSVIRRQLRLPSAVGAVCRQILIDKGRLPQPFGSMPSVWFDYGLFGASYGWMFPFGQDMRIGCGVPAGEGASRQLKRSFFLWLKHMQIPVNAGKIQTGSIGCRYVGHRFGNIFIAGDAAGMASSVTGEGIYQALVSGREVAREILDASYCSSLITELAIRHERTFQTLNYSLFGKFLYNNAALFLRYPAIAEAALSRFA